MVQESEAFSSASLSRSFTPLSRSVFEAALIMVFTSKKIYLLIMVHRVYGEAHMMPAVGFVVVVVVVVLFLLSPELPCQLLN